MMAKAAAETGGRVFEVGEGTEEERRSMQGPATPFYSPPWYLYYTFPLQARGGIHRVLYSDAKAACFLK